MWSVNTLNVALAACSVVAAIGALGLLAFVIARERYVRDSEALARKERIKRHESVIVDFTNPATIPDHFLQLNTLMFDKSKRRPKNNQITEVDANKIIRIPGLDMMSSISEDEEATSSLDRASRRTGSEYTETTDASSSADSEEYSDAPNNEVRGKDVYGNHLRHKRHLSNQLPHDLTLQTTDTSITDALTTEASGEQPKSSQSSHEPPTTEEITIEPPAHKIILELECGSNYSLC